MQFRPDSHEKALIDDVMKLKYKYGSEKLMLRNNEKWQKYQRY